MPLGCFVKSGELHRRQTIKPRAYSDNDPDNLAAIWAITRKASNSIIDAFFGDDTQQRHGPIIRP
ncbi:MAG: hypothetical protein COA84_10275 [Robiginitomaculum sp.]|nr:MAG: hypothetical protein COA84_10275 [Robiginitomaculum sp.]